MIDNSLSFREEAIYQVRRDGCPGCGKTMRQLVDAGVQVRAHHVVYAQEVRRRRGAMHDTRNALGVCDPCHVAHHAGRRPLPLASLPREALEFAGELLGSPFAEDYLTRRYAAG